MPATNCLRHFYVKELESSLLESKNFPLYLKFQPGLKPKWVANQRGCFAVTFVLNFSAQPEFLMLSHIGLYMPVNLIKNSSPVSSN